MCQLFYPSGHFKKGKENNRELNRIEQIKNAPSQLRKGACSILFYEFKIAYLRPPRPPPERPEDPRLLPLREELPRV